LDLDKYNITILYEDNHLLVVEKPVNIPSQEDISGDPDLLSLLKKDIKIRYQKPGNVYLGLVHRLDRPVGGVMVFAKTSKAASRLSEQIRTQAFGKYYLAVVHGRPKDKQGRLEHYLKKNKAANTVQVVSPAVPGGKHAILEYQVRSSTDKFSLVHVNLMTGRSHQIRVQFAAIGHPLFGDQKYGAHLNSPGQQIALWSHQINFRHPTTKEEMIFTSPPPDEYPWNLHI
jgi:23S rRNA pseudouridine1911/1915/1917 synthase